MSRTQTPWTYQGRPFKEAPADHIGFLYLISCTHPDVQKKYVGRKFFWFKFNTKTMRSQSDWRTYKGSSKSVLADIEKYGEQHFTFEITQLFKTKGGIVAGELESLWAAQVLYAKKADGTREYYNDSIGNIKFIAKEYLTEEHRAKIGAASKARMQGPEAVATAAAMGSANKGRVHSPESKERMAQANARRGQPATTQKFDDWEVFQAIELFEAGLRRVDIAKLTGMNPTTLSKINKGLKPRYKEIHEDYQGFLGQANHH